MRALFWLTLVVCVAVTIADDLSNPTAQVTYTKLAELLGDWAVGQNIGGLEAAQRDFLNHPAPPPILDTMGMPQLLSDSQTKSILADLNTPLTADLKTTLAPDCNLSIAEDCTALPSNE